MPERVNNVMWVSRSRPLGCVRGTAMTLLEKLQKQVKQLPPEQQQEVLDFVEFLSERTVRAHAERVRSLHTHPAFGSWRARQIDGLRYQRAMRAEWDTHP
jgi:hypothetical protein